MISTVKHDAGAFRRVFRRLDIRSVAANVGSPPSTSVMQQTRTILRGSIERQKGPAKRFTSAPLLTQPDVRDRPARACGVGGWEHDRTGRGRRPAPLALLHPPPHFTPGVPSNFFSMEVQQSM